MAAEFKNYRPLAEALDTPFTKTADREQGWTRYEALLRPRADESVCEANMTRRHLENAICKQRQAALRRYAPPLASTATT